MTRTIATLAAAITSVIAVDAEAGKKYFAKHRVRAVRTPAIVFAPTGGHYVGTPHSAYLHGKADVIRSTGYAVESFSRANINNQIARSLKLDNDTKSVEERWKQRKIWRENFNEDMRTRRARVSNYLKNYKSQAPKRFTSEDFDAQGRLVWPKCLTSETFAGYRAELAKLFAVKAAGGAPGLSKQIHRTTEDFKKVLSGYMSQLKVNEYLNAKEFLTRLGAM